MKHITRAFIVVLLAVLAFSTGRAQDNTLLESWASSSPGLVRIENGMGKVYQPEKQELLDLAVVRIESPAARELMKSDTIRVRRRKTDYVPEGELPVLQLEQIDDDLCQRRLQEVIQKHSRQDVGEPQIKKKGDVLVAQLNTASCWISRGSGAFKFTHIRDSMATPTQIDDFKRAVQIALDHVGQTRLVDLVDGEEIDILFVSAVRNVLTEVDQAEPREEFTSDYYVGFGRRYRGVPMIGSRIVIRLDGNGDVAMAQKVWRAIVDVGPGKAIVSRQSIQDLVVNDPVFRERHSTGPVSPQQVTIVDKQCGYMEAPVHYVQESLRPGCSVSFQVGESVDETYPQIVISLEDNGSVQSMWGSGYQSKP